MPPVAHVRVLHGPAHTAGPRAPPNAGGGRGAGAGGGRADPCPCQCTNSRVMYR
jgi:hypothetical protein